MKNIFIIFAAIGSLISTYFIIKAIWLFYKALTYCHHRGDITENKKNFKIYFIKMIKSFLIGFGIWIGLFLIAALIVVLFPK
jgi:hypothetical protein